MAALYVKEPEEISVDEFHRTDNSEFTAASNLNRSSSSRCREFMPARLLKVLLKDPAAFLFVISLFGFAICMPFLGLYLKDANHLLDLDNMEVWNSYIGKLYQKHFTMYGPLNVTMVDSNPIPCDEKTHSCATIGVRLKFDIDKSVFKQSNISTLVGNFSGTELNTIITDSGGRRIDDAINVHIMLDINQSRNNCLSNGYCSKIKGCVLISAPINATGFDQLLHPSATASKPLGYQFCSKADTTHYYRNPSTVYNLKITKRKSVVKTSGTQVRKHGLILLYVSKEDEGVAAHRIYKASVIFVGLALAFLIGLTCVSSSKPQQMELSNHIE